MTPLAPRDDGVPLDVGVVIVTYNSERHIRPLMESLPAAFGEMTWDAVVVDNASADATVARLKEHGCAAVPMGRNAGYAAAINRGLTNFPTARSLLVLNPDVVVNAGAVAELQRALDDPGVGIAAPQTRGFDGRLHLTLRRDPSIIRAFGAAVLGGPLADRLGGLSETVSSGRQYEMAHDVDWAVGSTLLISRACVDLVGPWDERYFLYSEETDFCERARGAGFRVRYAPAAMVKHEGGGGIGQPRLRSMMMINRVRQYRSRHSTAASWAFYLAVLLNESIRGFAGNKAARVAATALVKPSIRPAELNAPRSLLPE